MTKAAIGYVRVSTEGQATEGVSMDAQQAKIQAWCLANPTSPTRFRNTVVSAVSAQKFPLHFALDYFGRQFETQLFEKDLLVISRF